jgi:putative hydroxymethylpyrimidine transport system substrate-binding protein
VGASAFGSVVVRHRRLALALAAALTLLAGCGEKSDPTGPESARSLSLMLDYFPNADHAGIYAAEANGDFRRAGLAVTPRVPPDPSAPLKLLAAGKVDLAISYEPEVLLARDRGLEVVSIAALVQKPLTSIISLSKRVQTVGDLEGKRVGTAGIPYQAAYLKTILEEAGLPPGSAKEVNVGFNLVPAMLSKRVDATLGSFWNYEGVQLQLQRRRPRIIRVESVGVPTYNELVIVARKEQVRRDGSRLRAFLQALTRGHEALRRDPEPALDELLRANGDLDRRHQEAVVRKTLPVFFPENRKRPFGYQDTREWEAYGRWMFERKLLRAPLHGAAALTNEFLPGEGI